MESVEGEDMQQRHRRERKDLQAKVQALKKTAIKGDKKKKKEVAEEIQKLEDDLNKKHNMELSFDPTELPDEELEETTKNLSLCNGKENDAAHKPSKAQRRRDKKASELKERELRIAEQEEQNIFGTRNVEIEAIKKLLKDRGLSINEIPSDGNCLYCAVEDQLKQKGDKSLHNVGELRKKTSDVLREEMTEFLPFLSHPDTGEMLTESQYMTYCDQVRDTTSWGGQIELKALSKALGCKIEVIQSSGPPVVSGEGEGVPHLVITYHRHMFGLGEHYNSTKPYESEAED